MAGNVKRAPVARTVGAFLAAVLSTFVIAAVLHTHFVLGALVGIGVEVPFGVRVSTTLHDIYGLFVGLGLMSYPSIIAVGFVIALPVFAVVRRFVNIPPVFAYSLAGACAMAVMLGLMYILFEGSPIAGARGSAGFVAQCFAGALGGAVFASIARPRMDAA